MCICQFGETTLHNQRVTILLLYKIPISCVMAKYLVYLNKNISIDGSDLMRQRTANNQIKQNFVLESENASLVLYQIITFSHIAHVRDSLKQSRSIIASRLLSLCFIHYIFSCSSFKKYPIVCPMFTCNNGNQNNILHFQTEKIVWDCVVLGEGY